MEVSDKKRTDLVQTILVHPTLSVPPSDATRRDAWADSFWGAVQYDLQPVADIKGTRQ